MDEDDDKSCIISLTIITFIMDLLFRKQIYFVAAHGNDFNEVWL